MMILGLSWDVTFAGLGACLAGLGSFFTGLAALRSASHKEEDFQDAEAETPRKPVLLMVSSLGLAGAARATARRWRSGSARRASRRRRPRP